MLPAWSIAAAPAALSALERVSGELLRDAASFAQILRNGPATDETAGDAASEASAHLEATLSQLADRIESRLDAAGVGQDASLRIGRNFFGELTVSGSEDDAAVARLLDEDPAFRELLREAAEAAQRLAAKQGRQLPLDEVRVQYAAGSARWSG